MKVLKYLCTCLCLGSQGSPGCLWDGLVPIAGGEGRWLQARGAGRGGCKAGRGEEDNMWLEGRAWPGQTDPVASRPFYEYIYRQPVCWKDVWPRVWVGGKLWDCVDHICNGRQSLLRPLSHAGRGQGRPTKIWQNFNDIVNVFLDVLSSLRPIPVTRVSNVMEGRLDLIL